MDKEARTKAIENLTKLSLARLASDSILTIHDLTKDFVMAYVRERRDNDPINAAVRLVSEALHSVKAPESPDSWPLCAELVPHLRCQISNHNDECHDSPLQYQAAIIASQYLGASGRYHPA